MGQHLREKENGVVMERMKYEGKGRGNYRIEERERVCVCAGGDDEFSLVGIIREVFSNFH